MESWKSEVVRNGSVSYSCIQSKFYSLVKASCITMIPDWRKNWRESLQRYVFFIRCDWLLFPLPNAEISVCRLWMAVQSLLMYIQRLQTEISDGLFWKDCSLLWWSHLAAFVKWRCFLGKVIWLILQSDVASLARSLRFLGKLIALRWRCHCASGGSGASCWFLVRGIAGEMFCLWGVKFGSLSLPVGCWSVARENGLLAVPSVLARCA